MDEVLLLAIETQMYAVCSLLLCTIFLIDSAKNMIFEKTVRRQHRKLTLASGNIINRRQLFEGCGLFSKAIARRVVREAYEILIVDGKETL